MIGDHNACSAGFSGLVGAPDSHNARQEEGDSSVFHDFPQLFHTFGAGGGIHIFKERQAGGVNVHTQDLSAVFLGLVNFSEHQIPAPGLDGGNGEAVGFHGLTAGRE